MSALELGAVGRGVAEQGAARPGTVGQGMGAYGVIDSPVTGSSIRVHPYGVYLSQSYGCARIERMIDLVRDESSRGIRDETFEIFANRDRTSLDE